MELYWKATKCAIISSLVFTAIGFFARGIKYGFDATEPNFYIQFAVISFVSAFLGFLVGAESRHR